MLKFCMQDYKDYGVDEIDHGSYTVKGATCIEAQINGLVARVVLSRNKYDTSTYRIKDLPLITKGKKRKRDMDDNSRAKRIDGNTNSNRKQLIHKQKSVTKNIYGYINLYKKYSVPNQPSLATEIDGNTNSHRQTISTEPIDGNTNLFKKQLISKTSEILKKLNGDQVSGKRVRKPNSKFSDYVVSSNYDVADEMDTDDQTSSSNEDEFSTRLPKPKVMRSYNEIAGPRLHKARVKERILSHTDDDQKLDTHVTVDPLDLHHNDDVVHSFLPMFEPPPVLDYKDDEPESEMQSPSSPKTTDKTGKSSGVGVSKTQAILTHALPGKDVQRPISVLSSNWKGTVKSPQLYGKVLCMPLILTTNSQNSVINVNDVSNQQLTLLNKTDQRWVQIQPKPSDTPPLAPLTPAVRKEVPQKTSVSTKSVLKSNYINKPKAKFTDSFSPKPEPKPMLAASRYVLVECDTKYKPAKVSDIDFNKLVRSLKSVKLPAKNWKIRIIVSPQETITEVIFTSKEQIERCVKFSRAVPGYKITFGKSEVKLLGAPTLQTFDDIAILLEIIHSIDATSLVLEYC